MNQRFDSYTPVLESLVAEAIQCSPPGWERGVLTIACDGSYLDYALKNSGSDDKAQISDALRQLCEDLYVVMRQAGDTWDKAIVSFARKDGAWSFTVDFDRGEAVRERHAAATPSAPAGKPWWKFWQ